MEKPKDIHQVNTREARRKKSLGELGELFAMKALIDNEFDKIRNLNDDHMNEVFADILCEKNQMRYVISVKARNKFQLDGRMNSRYNLGARVYENAELSKKKYNAVACWMAIQFDVHEYSVFWGTMESLQGARAIPLDKCDSGVLGIRLVDRKRHYFDFSFYKNVLKRTPPNTTS